LENDGFGILRDYEYRLFQLHFFERMYLDILLQKNAKGTDPFNAFAGTGKVMRSRRFYGSNDIAILAALSISATICADGNCFQGYADASACIDLDLWKCGNAVVTAKQAQATPGDRGAFRSADGEGG
jgi:hypothetical protein